MNKAHLTSDLQNLGSKQASILNSSCFRDLGCHRWVFLPGNPMTNLKQLMVCTKVRDCLRQRQQENFMSLMMLVVSVIRVIALR